MKRWAQTHTQRPSSSAAPSASTALYKASAPSTMAPSSSATGSSSSSNTNNNAASTTDDVAGMLDFGNSVVVTEDMRRSVQAETEVVVQAIQKLTNSHKTEQATGARLLQDLRHAHKELLSQERTTKDKRDSAGIHAECRKQLSETLKTRLIDPLAVALPAHTLQQLFPDSADAATDDVDTVANKDKNGSSVTTTKQQQKKKSSNPAYLDQAKQKVLHLGNHLQESQTILEQRKASIARKQKATRALQHSIQERNLEATLQAGRRDTATKRREEQSGADKVRSVQEIIQQLRDKGGESAQKITKLTTALANLKKENAAKEKEHHIKVKEQQEAFEATKANSTVEHQLDDISRKRIKLQSTLSSIQNASKTRESHDVKEVQLQEQLSKKVKTKEELIAKLEAAKERQASVVATRLQAARAEAKDIADVTEENDKIATKQATEDKSERESLSKQKEQLTLLTTGVAENAGKTMEDLTCKLQEGKLKLNSLEEERARRTKTLEDEQIKKAHLEQTRNQSVGKHSMTYDDHVQRNEQTKTTADTEAERLKRMSKKHDEEYQERIEEHEKKEREQILHFYDYAGEFVDQNKNLRDKLEAEGVVLDMQS